MKKLLTLMAGLALAALAVGCDTSTNSNNGNGNTAVVNTNANTANRNATNANAANANRAAAPTREEYEKNKETYGKQAKDVGSKIGAGAEDLWLWTKVRAALAAVDDLRDSTINVDVDNAVVTLRGTVASADQVKKAETAAKVEGVKSVKSELKVGAATGGNSNTANSNGKAKK
jgi:osmotically-inducible protein OsmY